MELRELTKIIHQNNREKGFWDKPRNVGEMLMLVVSELGEAIEAHRQRQFANFDEFNQTLANLTNATGDEMKAKKTAFEVILKDTFEDEISDAIIRLLDMAGGLDIDIQKHIELKMEYNKTRQRLHGKGY